MAKSEEMKQLLAKMFPEETSRREKGICPRCSSSKTKREDFSDSFSWREFHISGLCQDCQDSSFSQRDIEF